MCVLSHVLEAAGLATTALISVRPVAEQMHPPRALYCHFPLGRPLGVPNDPAFQHGVLRHAFDLLARPSGPVLEDHPDVVEFSETPLACSLPPRFDPTVPEAVEEARALRDAYERAVRAHGGRTSVGRVTDAAGVPDVVAAFVAVAGGTPWDEAGLPGDPIQAAHDVRTYYEEAALDLVDVDPAPGAAEAWFYDVTAAGAAVLAARRAMQEAGVPFPFWFYMARGSRR
ncbi:MAG: hypothetical protein R2726_03675 [Acidimicrobiales bacterium]